MGLLTFFKNLLKGRTKKRKNKRIKRRKCPHKQRPKKIPSKKVFKKLKRLSKKRIKNRQPKQSKSIKKKRRSPLIATPALKKQVVSSSAGPAKIQIGIITHYFDKISVGIIKLSSALAVGSVIHIKGNKTDCAQVVASMQYNHKEITYAEKGLEIGIKVNQPVQERDGVFLV